MSCLATDVAWELTPTPLTEHDDPRGVCYFPVIHVAHELYSARFAS